MDQVFSDIIENIFAAVSYMKIICIHFISQLLFIKFTTKGLLPERLDPDPRQPAGKRHGG
jgi:hypothetical protein